MMKVIIPRIITYGALVLGSIRLHEDSPMYILEEDKLVEDQWV